MTLGKKNPLMTACPNQFIQAWGLAGTVPVLGVNRGVGGWGKRKGRYGSRGIRDGVVRQVPAAGRADAADHP